MYSVSGIVAKFVPGGITPGANSSETSCSGSKNDRGFQTVAGQSVPSQFAPSSDRNVHSAIPERPRFVVIRMTPAAASAP